MNAVAAWRAVRSRLPVGSYAEELEPIVTAGDRLAAEVVELRRKLREAEPEPTPFVLSDD